MPFNKKTIIVLTHTGEMIGEIRENLRNSGQHTPLYKVTKELDYMNKQRIRIIHRNGTAHNTPKTLEDRVKYVQTFMATVEILDKHGNLSQRNWRAYDRIIKEHNL